MLKKRLENTWNFGKVWDNWHWLTDYLTVWSTEVRQADPSGSNKPVYGCTLMQQAHLENFFFWLKQKNYMILIL